MHWSPPPRSRTLVATDDADTKALAPDDGVGCPYRTRCPRREGRCDTDAPAVTALADRTIRCHYPLAGLVDEPVEQAAVQRSHQS